MPEVHLPNRVNNRAGAGDAFITAVAVYPDDVTVLEPQLLKFYKDLLSTIEAAHTSRIER